MEHGPFEDVFPCISYWIWGYSVAMLVCQRVTFLTWKWGFALQVRRFGIWSFHHHFSRVQLFVFRVVCINWCHPMVVYYPKRLMNGMSCKYAQSTSNIWYQQDYYTPGNVAMQYGPFEEVVPVEHGDFPASDVSSPERTCGYQAGRSSVPGCSCPSNPIWPFLTICYEGHVGC